MNSNLLQNSEYKHWLKALKQKVQQSLLKAVVQVNSTLLEFYWELGEEIVQRQAQARWGDGFLKQLSQDLIAEFPEMKGFSKRNLEQIRKWFQFWSSASEIAQQPVSQLTQIPWGHNLKIIAKCQSVEEVVFYVQNTLDNGWSRSVLTHQIESGLWQREGKAISNFNETLPAPQSDLAQQALKDPYVFDFLTLSKQHSERKLEQGLIEHITHFLLELGADFAFMGKQYPRRMGKATACPSIWRGFIDGHVVPPLPILQFEYALSDSQKPIGVSEYQLTQSLPENLQSKLPSIQEIENEFGGEL